MLKPVRLKPVRNTAVAALLALGLAACSEGPTSPVSISADAAEPLLAKGGKRATSESNYSSRTFRIRPGKAVKEAFGEHVLWMPANVVCDPATSGYGVAFWDQPCNPARDEIEVTAYWAEYNGNPVIRFEPDLRFVPSDDAKRWVTLSMKHTKDIEPEHYYTILWRDPVSGSWMDESVEDASQKAEANQNLRRVSRRLKHFSDYLLWFGLGSYNVTSG